MRTGAGYHAIAALLTYPNEEYAARCTAALDAVRQLSDAAMPGTAAFAGADGPEQPARGEHPYSLLQAFAAHASALPLDQQQELFTLTFDLNPLCSLEIGWHLFGENYDRGLLLVRIRQELRRYGLHENQELPDHLTNVLPLIARMERERAADFAAACVLPALDKMLAALRGRDNPYETVLRALSGLLHADFPEIPLGAAEGPPALRVLSQGAAS